MSLNLPGSDKGFRFCLTHLQQALFHNQVNVKNSQHFGRDVSSYAIECQYLSEALETFNHYQFYKTLKKIISVN